MHCDFVEGNNSTRNIETEYNRFKSYIQDFSNPARRKSKGLFIPKPLLGVFDPREVIALKRGIKPVIGSKLPYRRTLWAKAERWAHQNNMAIARSKKKFINVDQTSYYADFDLNEEPEASVFVAVSYSKKDAEEAAMLYKKDPYRLGFSLGYPECCLKAARKYQVAAEIKSVSSPDWSKAFNWTCLHSKHFSPYLNAFNHARLISHVPCKLDCKRSIKYAKKLLELIEEEHYLLSRSYGFFMKTQSLYWNYYNHFLFQGILKGRNFYYHDFRPMIANPLSPRHLKDPEREKASSCLELVKQGNNLAVKKERIEFFSYSKKIGEISRENEFDVVLAIPDKE